LGLDRLRLLVAVALTGFSAAWLAYTEGYAPSGGRPLGWRTTAVGRLQLPRATTAFFHERSDFDGFLDDLHVAAVRPRIDFGRDAAVLIALGPRSSTGIAVNVLRVEEQRGRVLVLVREQSVPGAAAVVSYPSVVVVLRETGKPIAVEWR